MPESIDSPNPYNYNLPVAPEMFFGRQQDVTGLRRDLMAYPGDSFALIGGRRMGKTSLLEALLRALDELQPNTPLMPLPLFLDLSGENIRSVAEFFQQVGSQAQGALETTLGMPLESFPGQTGQPPALIMERILPTWERVVMNSLGRRLRLILLLDECEQIANHDWSPELYSALRHLLVGRATRSLLKVVMVGSHTFLSRVRQEGSPLRNVLKYHMLRGLDYAAVEQLVNVPTGGILPGEVTQAVIAQSGAHPFLTQYLMHGLWNYDLERATPEQVQRLADNFPHERSDFKDWLDGLGDSGRIVYAALLNLAEPVSEDRLLQAVHPPVQGFIQALDALCYHGLVTYEQVGIEKRYHPAGQMFQTWFRTSGLELSSASQAPETPPQTAPAVSVHVDITNTGGGAYISGDVDTGGGEFIGRDNTDTSGG